MVGTILDTATLAIAGVLLLWGVYALIVWLKPSAANTAAGQVVGKFVNTTQGYAWYGMLEAMKQDDLIEADANNLAAIAYLQASALKEVAKDWTTKPEASVVSEKINTQDDHANEVTWSPK